MKPFGITVDGVFYSVHVEYESLKRAFEIIEGRNSGTMLTGRQTRDVLGTGYSYSMAIQPDPSDPESYDALYEVLSAPVASHMVTLPYGQGTITFEAMIESGEDVYSGTLGGKKRWSGLEISFRYVQPYRV